MKLVVLTFALIIFCGLSGCATAPKQPKEPKLIFSGTYVTSMLTVKNALKDEPVKFETGAITKEEIKMRADYSDGRQMQFIITKVNSASSTLVIRPANAQTTAQDCRQTLDKIMRYCQLRKTGAN